MCAPFVAPLILGVVSAGLGIAQQQAQYKAAQQQVNYQNKQAIQNYQFQQMQVSSARAYENQKESQQQFLMEQTRLLAESAHADDIAQLNLRYMQEQEAAAQQRQEAQKARARGVGEAKATGRVGLSIDNLIADAYRQQAAFDYATDRNLAFTGAQIQEQKRGAAAGFASRLNSQSPYIKQAYLDPQRPQLQKQPSKVPFILGGISSVLGAGMTAYQQISALPSGPPPAPSPYPGRSGF